MVYVFSGEDIVSSRKAFLEHLEGLKSAGYEVERKNGKDLSLESLELMSTPTTLFGLEKALVIENLLTLSKSKDKEKVISRIASLSDCSTVIWESKDISKTEQLKFPQNFSFKNFKLPSVLFDFLDKFVPGKITENLRLLHIVLEQVDPTYVFLMFIRQIRLLLLCSDSIKPGLAPWQEAKLSRQVKYFTKDQLKDLYARLLEIDYRQKTSLSAFALNSELDLLIADI